MFIEDFFARAGTSTDALDVRLVRLSEPALGTPDPDTGRNRALAFRFPVPNNYTAGNPVTLRLFLYRTGPQNPGFCFAFRIDAKRLRDGAAIEDYGVPMFFKPEVEAAEEFMVVDIPVNAAPGLNYPNDLVSGQFLAFEFGTISPPEEGGLYHLLGAEVFETTIALPVSGGEIFTIAEETGCS